MKFKAGDKIRMKEDCSGIQKGEVCVLRYGSRNYTATDSLWAWGENDECWCQGIWQLIRKKVSKKKVTKKHEHIVRTWCLNHNGWAINQEYGCIKYGHQTVDKCVSCEEYLK